MENKGTSFIVDQIGQEVMAGTSPNCMRALLPLLQLRWNSRRLRAPSTAEPL